MEISGSRNLGETLAGFNVEALEDGLQGVCASSECFRGYSDSRRCILSSLDVGRWALDVF
jgi:hypothetical protein